MIFIVPFDARKLAVNVGKLKAPVQSFWTDKAQYVQNSKNVPLRSSENCTKVKNLLVTNIKKAAVKTFKLVIAICGIRLHKR